MDGVMPLIEILKEKVEKITGWRRPTRREVDAAVRQRKPNVFRFGDDGVVPNNGKLPLIVYRGPIRVAGAADPAALFEALFERNGWKNSWRDGIYDYLHYHSQIHEVLGIARGQATVLFGGSRGRAFKLKAGDVAILPAGTGHKRIDDGDDLLVREVRSLPRLERGARSCPENSSEGADSEERSCLWFGRPVGTPLAQEYVTHLGGSRDN